MDVITLRIAVLGAAGVGKTSLITRYADGSFSRNTDLTMHDVSVVRLQVEADIIKLMISDNAGNERYHQTARSYNRNADCLILVYDVTNRMTFEDLDTWLKVMKDVCDERAPIIIVGNKMDLPYQRREVSNQDIINYMQERRAVCMETSAKDDYNVNKVFSEAVKLTLKSQCLLVPGCEEDLYIRHLDSKLNIVPEPPERSLKKVLVSKASDNNKIVKPGEISPSKSSCSC